MNTFDITSKVETRRYDASLNECPDLYSLHNLPFSPYFARIVWNFISMAASKFSRSSFCPRMVSSPLMFDPLTCKLSPYMFSGLWISVAGISWQSLSRMHMRESFSWLHHCPALHRRMLFCHLTYLTLWFYELLLPAPFPETHLGQTICTTRFSFSIKNLLTERIDIRAANTDATNNSILYKEVKKSSAKSESIWSL